MHQSDFPTSDNPPRKNTASRLGTMLSDTFDNKEDVSNRLYDYISVCIAACKRKLKPALNGKSPLSDLNS